MFLHFSNFHMHSPTAARMRIWNLNLEVNSPSPESKHHSVHLKELYCGMLHPSCSKDKSWPLPWSPVQKLEKKKKDVENTLKRLYPAKHSRDVSGHLKEQALSRENSPLRSWVSTPKENLPHDTVSHRQKCCFISLLPSACPWPVTENPTIRRKYRTFLLTEAEKQWKFTFISSVHQVQWYKLIFWPRRYQLLNCCKCAIFYPNI